MAARYTEAYFTPHHFLATWRSEPPSILSYEIQSRHSQFDVQSRLSQFRRSDPPSLLSLGDQSHHVFNLAFRAVVRSQVFRAIITFQLRRS